MECLHKFVPTYIPSRLLFGFKQMHLLLANSVGVGFTVFPVFYIISHEVLFPYMNMVFAESSIGNWAASANTFKNGRRCMTHYACNVSVFTLEILYISISEWGKNNAVELLNNPCVANSAYPLWNLTSVQGILSHGSLEVYPHFRGWMAVVTQTFDSGCCSKVLGLQGITTIAPNGEQETLKCRH